MFRRAWALLWILGAQPVTGHRKPKVRLFCFAVLNTLFALYNWENLCYSWSLRGFVLLVSLHNQNYNYFLKWKHNLKTETHELPGLMNHSDYILNFFLIFYILCPAKQKVNALSLNRHKDSSVPNLSYSLHQIFSRWLPSCFFPGGFSQEHSFLFVTTGWICGIEAKELSADIKYGAHTQWFGVVSADAEITEPACTNPLGWEKPLRWSPTTNLFIVLV